MTETLRTVQGRPVLRIERRLAHAPEKVWPALTQADQLSQWYPFQTSDFDLQVGGVIHFRDGSGITMDAVITDVEQPQVFAFSNRAPKEMTRESTDLIHFELRQDDLGCLLIFTQIFDDRPAAASYATGWTGCLDGLDALLNGEPSPIGNRDPVATHEHYISEFGLGNGTQQVTEQGWTVRFDRQYMGLSPDAAWEALTAGERTEINGPVPAPFTHAALQAAKITALEAPKLLEYEWHADTEQGVVRWEISPGPGGARISLTQNGGPQASAQRLTALTAWRERLDQLARSADLS